MILQKIALQKQTVYSPTLATQQKSSFLPLPISPYLSKTNNVCMQIVQQLLFALCLGTAVWLFSKKVKEIRRNILLGVDEDLREKESHL